MHSFIALLLIKIVVIQAVSYQALVEEQWQTFKLEHGKFYQTDEEEIRRQNVFMENLHKITEHNKMYEMGLTSYKLGINHFADLTGEEFLKLYTTKMRIPLEYGQNLNFSYNDMYDGSSEESYVNMDDVVINESETEVDVEGLPTAVDWSTRGAVTAVKNQGQCGSCWSFSATGALEAQWFRKTGRLISLSEQNLVDCSWRFGNHGCNGGWMPSAFNYIKANGGIDTEQSYPYQARSGYCHYKIAGRGAIVRGVVQFSGEGQLQSKVTHVGPIAVAIEVGHSFHLYHSGVYNEPQCGRKPNHAVLVVGYGSERGGDYWLVKNSWGANWGDRGYIKMSRNRNNQCGIASYCSYPLV